MIPLRNKSQNVFLKNPMLKLLTELNSLDTNNIRILKVLLFLKVIAEIMRPPSNCVFDYREPKGIKYVSHGRLGSLLFLRT